MTIARKLWLGFGVLILIFVLACLVIFFIDLTLALPLLGGLLVGVLAAYLINRGVIDSVRRLEEGVDRVGRGDLDHRIEVDTRDELGKVAAAFNAMLDRRREAEAAFKESGEKFRGLSDASFEGIAIVEDGRVMETNTAFAQMHGYEPSEVVGMSTIFNDDSGRVLFTTYADGEQTNTVGKELPFDATSAFHEYRIDLYPTRAEFSVDGRLLHTFEEGLPGDSMKLMVNAWYPDWLPGEKPEADGYTEVDWIQR